MEDANLMLGCAYTQVWIRERFPGSGHFLQLGIVLFFSVIECPDETLWGITGTSCLFIRYFLVIVFMGVLPRVRPMNKRNISRKSCEP